MFEESVRLESYGCVCLQKVPSSRRARSFPLQSGLPSTNDRKLKSSFKPKIQFRRKFDGLHSYLNDVKRRKMEAMQPF